MAAAAAADPSRLTTTGRRRFVSRMDRALTSRSFSGEHVWSVRRFCLILIGWLLDGGAHWSVCLGCSSESVGFPIWVAFRAVGSFVDWLVVLVAYITGEHSYQNAIWCVKIGEYMGFSVTRGF